MAVDRKQQMKEITERLEQGVKDIFTSEMYTTYIQRPADFTGHSLSVSDVVVLNDGSTVKAYYVDSIGFAELPDFFKERNMDLQKENLLNEKLQEIEIFDKPGLFSNGRLRDSKLENLGSVMSSD